MHHVIRVKDGKNYVALWNKAFINALKNSCSNTSLCNDIITNAIHGDPLTQNIQIGNCINRNFKATTKNIKLFQNKLVFDPTVIKPKNKKFRWF